MPHWGGILGHSLRSCRANHETSTGRVHDLAGDRLQAVELRDTSDLGHETIEQAKVARRDPDDGGRGFLIGELGRVQLAAECRPVVAENEGHFLLAERPEGMGKPHARIELWIPCQAFFEPWHADQDEADSLAIIKVPELLEALHL